MDRLARILSGVLFFILPLVAALKFDLHPVAQHDSAKYERCIRNFVAREQLVVVTANLDGYRGDGQRVDMHVRCCYVEFTFALRYTTTSITRLDEESLITVK